jgi:hypothetical protein
MSFHLALIVGVQDVIERKAPFCKVLLKAVPDGDYLRVIGNRTEYEGCLAHGVAPLE